MSQKGVALNLDVYKRRKQLSSLSVAKAGAKSEEHAIRTMYNDNVNDASLATSQTTSVLAHLVVQSHYIIARSKRHAIANTARELNLRGYVWAVGWN